MIDFFIIFLAASTAATPAGGGGASVAAIIPSKPAGSFGSVEQIVQKLFDIASGVAGAIFLLIFLFGAIQYLTGAAGQEDQLTKAKKIMMNAAVGLLLVAGAWTIAKFLGGELGAPGF